MGDAATASRFPRRRIHAAACRTSRKAGGATISQAKNASHCLDTMPDHVFDRVVIWRRIPAAGEEIVLTEDRHALHVVVIPERVRGVRGAPIDAGNQLVLCA